MIDKIKEIIEPIIQEDSVELVEMIYGREAGRQVLRLLVDKEGGIQLSDCARLNQKIGQVLDEQNIIQESYVIEVDSPGVDRQFKAKRLRRLRKRGVLDNKKETKYLKRMLPYG